uniref:C-type lectin domain-containing protein n=1 Tax=Oncorhynchus kisutch TaxID=8019 RepID=A0A8C7MG09_ONCKI
YKKNSQILKSYLGQRMCNYHLEKRTKSKYITPSSEVLLFYFRQSEVQGCKACAKNWVFHGGKYYCVSMGGHLVIINSQENFSGSTIGDDMNHWIRLNDLETERWWLWVDNKPLSQTGFLSKGKDEPDNWNRPDPSGEDCAALGNDRIGAYVWFEK